MFWRKKKDLGTTTVTLDGEANPSEAPKYYHWVLQDHDEAKDSLYDKLCCLFDRFEPEVSLKAGQSCDGLSTMYVFPKEAGQVKVVTRYYYRNFGASLRYINVLDMEDQKLCAFTLEQLNTVADVEDRLCDAIDKCGNRTSAAEDKRGLDRAHSLIDGILS